MVRVSIIIVNWNGSAFLDRLIRSIVDQKSPEYEIIFVDNGSSDSSLDVLVGLINEFPAFRDHIKTVSLKSNLGFCKGANIGLNHSITGEYIIYLNNDTYVSKNWLKSLVKLLDSNPDIGAVQSIIVNARDNTVQSAGFMMNKYCESHPNRAIKLEENGILTEGFFYLSGACLAIRRSIIDKVGALDENLFYGDYDLCWRVRLLNYELAVALNSICFHYGGASRERIFPNEQEFLYYSFEKMYVMLKNYCLKNVLTGIPITMTISLAMAIDNSLHFKNPSFLLSFFKSFLLFLKKLGNCLRKRKYIQQIRIVEDAQIARSFLPYSFLSLRRLRRILKSC